MDADVILAYVAEGLRVMRLQNGNPPVAVALCRDEFDIIRVAMVQENEPGAFYAPDGKSVLWDGDVELFIDSAAWRMPIEDPENSCVAAPTVTPWKFLPCP